jgi:hypothetical protein
MAQTPPNGRQPSLDQNRQEALTRVMALQDSRDSQPRVGLGDGGDPRLMALDYALHLLGDSRPLVSADGTLTDLLEANGFTYREVRTPTDLLRSSRTVLLLLRRFSMSPPASLTPMSSIPVGPAEYGPGHNSLFLASKAT